MLARLCIAATVCLALAAFAFGGWVGGGSFEQNQDETEVPSGGPEMHLGYHAGYDGGGENLVQNDWAIARAKYHADGWAPQGSSSLVNQDDHTVSALNLIDAYWEFHGCCHGQMYTDYEMTQYCSGAGYVVLGDELTAAEMYSETTDMTVPCWNVQPMPTLPIQESEFCQRQAELDVQAEDSDTYSLPYKVFTVRRDGVAIPPEVNVVYAEYQLLTKILWAGDNGSVYSFDTGANFAPNGMKSFTKIRKPYLK
jgi:hypothetical protein